MIFNKKRQKIRIYLVIQKKSSTFVPIMKRSILSLLFVLTATTLCRAAVISYDHEFQVLNALGTIAFSNSNKTATVSGTLPLVYNCYNTGVFGPDLVYKSKASINLPAKNDSVIITPAIEYLKGLRIYYYTSDATKVGMNIFISSDARTWRQLADSELLKAAGNVVATFSSGPGTYAVKIVNASSVKTNGISIFKITYETDPCPNCFRYVAE